jgi:hypothetical protein
MFTMFTEDDYEKLHELVFRPDYSGYKPTVKEIPNGDGKVDAEKMFAHVAPKYFTTDEQRHALMPFLERAHELAVEAGNLIELGPEFMPDIRYGALRILDYPPGAVSNLHEDFDLFTLMCFRDQPDRFKAHETAAAQDEAGQPRRLDVIDKIRTLNQQAHLGQLGAAIGLGSATPHEVLPSETRQRSIVYFAIPDHASALPSGTLVRDWLNERMARSRTAFKAYE